MITDLDLTGKGVAQVVDGKTITTYDKLKDGFLGVRFNPEEWKDSETMLDIYKPRGQDVVIEVIETTLDYESTTILTKQRRYLVSTTNIVLAPEKLAPYVTSVEDTKYFLPLAIGFMGTPTYNGLVRDAGLLYSMFDTENKLSPVNMPKKEVPTV